VCFSFHGTFIPVFKTVHTRKNVTRYIIAILSWLCKRENKKKEEEKVTKNEVQQFNL
jgi:hypothetical protein